MSRPTRRLRLAVVAAATIAAISGCGAGYGTPVAGSGQTTTAAAPGAVATTPDPPGAAAPGAATPGTTTTGDGAPGTATAPGTASPPSAATTTTPDGTSGGAGAAAAPATGPVSIAVYAPAADRFCDRFSRASNRLTAGYDAAAGKAGTLGPVFVRFAAAVVAAVAPLRALSPPTALHRFQTRLLTWADRVTEMVGANRGALKAGDPTTAKQVARQVMALPPPPTGGQIPDLLTRRAPACAALAG